MNQKKSTTLYGSLMSPLTVGHCALIRYQGQLMRTSKVVAIHSRSADMICFETLNTNYTLLLVPAYQTVAVNPLLTSMAALESEAVHRK